MPLALAVMGMHRSGTSALSRAFNLAGAFLGRDKDIMAPAPDNPAGFWERDDIVEFHGRLLAAFGRTWDTTDPLPAGWPKDPAARPFREELALLVSRAFASKELWAFKDPRTCLLLPLWKDVLAQMGIGLAAALAVRNPLDVARSLEKRDGFSRGKCWALWQNYNLSAWESTSGLPRAVVHFDALMADWKREMEKCARVLGLRWPGPSRFMAPRMRRFLRGDLVHSCSSAAALKRAGAPQDVLRLYAFLEAEARRGFSDGTPFTH